MAQKRTHTTGAIFLVAATFLNGDPASMGQSSSWIQRRSRCKPTRAQPYSHVLLFSPKHKGNPNPNKMGKDDVHPTRVVLKNSTIKLIGSRLLPFEELIFSASRPFSKMCRHPISRTVVCEIASRCDIDCPLGRKHSRFTNYGLPREPRLGVDGMVM
jgi:hypothetical protein